MIMVCPCGQVHDGMDCPEGLQPVATEDVSMEPEVPEDGKATTAAESAAAAQPQDVDGDQPEGMTSSEGVGSAGSAADCSMTLLDHPAGTSEDLGSLSLAEPSAAFEDVVSFVPDASVALTIEDLEALGLGGASSWLQDFSDMLQA